MPDILGYWDRWADQWYYPRAYSDLSPLEKWAGREPTRADKKKYEEYFLRQRESRKREKLRQRPYLTIHVE